MKLVVHICIPRTAHFENGMHVVLYNIDLGLVQVIHIMHVCLNDSCIDMGMHNRSKLLKRNNIDRIGTCIIN